MVVLRYFAAMATALLTIADCTSALPSLKLHFTIKRPSMAVHGATVFDVFVTPVTSGDNIIFNAKTTIEQDGATHTFYLVDSVPYHEMVNSTIKTVRCQSPDAIPNALDVVEAIASAVPISSVETDQDISCANGTWLSTEFDGEAYVLCSTSEPENNNFVVYGADLSISFEYLTTDVTISRPANAPTNCAFFSDGSVPLSKLANIYNKPLSGPHRMLKDETSSAYLAVSSCSCQSTPRPCLFFHGMDVKEDGGIVDDYSFFGDIKQHAPCCSSFSFAILNTVDYEWYNSTLQQKVCDAAMNVSTGTTDSDSTVINDLIIVAHSMGNNMLASALADDKCSIGRNVDWVDLSGPLKGSMGSDFIHEICDGRDDHGDPDVLSKLGGLIGQCPGSTTRRSLVYDGGAYCDAEMSARYAASRAMHQKYVTASVCGTTFNGLLSKEYAGLLAGGLIIPHHSRKNDGAVEFQSCIGDLNADLFDATYKSTWYAAKLNHADTTFHDGDGLFSKAQKPLKWFECLL